MIRLGEIFYTGRGTICIANNEISSKFDSFGAPKVTFSELLVEISESRRIYSDQKGNFDELLDRDLDGVVRSALENFPR